MDFPFTDTVYMKVEFYLLFPFLPARIGKIPLKLKVSFNSFSAFAGRGGFPILQYLLGV
jgi:hypothetical protein